LIETLLTLSIGMILLGLYVAAPHETGPDEAEE
jgi:hypothetical protein